VGSISLVIPGKPLGKQRPRMCRSGRAYTPTQTVNYETLVRELFAVKYPKFVPMPGAVDVYICAVYSIPKSVTKKRLVEIEAGRELPTKTPDADNIAKIVTDALNGFAYDDDKQIVNLTVRKYYGDAPSVSVAVAIHKVYDET